MPGSKPDHWNQTVTNYFQLKQTWPLHDVEYCINLCFRKTSQCSMRWSNRSPEQQTYQDLLDQNSKKYLNPFSYLRSAVSSQYDIDVSCFNCRNETQGNLCQYCRTGYYDLNRRDRISKMVATLKTSKAISKESTLEYQILKLPVECTPCNCTKEGSFKSHCFQSADWNDWINPWSVTKERATLQYETYKTDRLNDHDAGDCFCRPGYKGQSCNECDPEHPDKPRTAPSERLLAWWDRQERRNKDTPNFKSRRRLCVKVACQEPSDCDHRDSEATCHNGNCICSQKYYGRNCTFYQENWNNDDENEIGNTGYRSWPQNLPLCLMLPLLLISGRA